MSAADTAVTAVKGLAPLWLAPEAASRAEAARLRRRVTYWTGWLSPEMEGCSKEVFALKDHFRRSRVIGLSRHYTLKASVRDRYLGLHVRFYPLLRAAAPLCEWPTDVHHVYGTLNEWFFLRLLRRRPIVMTVAAAAASLDYRMYSRVSRFVVHAAASRDQLLMLGISPDRITMIRPGVDLTRFRPLPRATAPSGAWPFWNSARFRVLFATTPNFAEGITTRGVDVIVEAARQMPDVSFYLPWRPWAGSERLLAEWLPDLPPNIRVSTELIPNMAEVYQSADATVAPFLTANDMKVCPTSLVESLACGRPVLVSSHVGMRDIVAKERCGEVFDPSVEGLCGAVEALRSRHGDAARRARQAAERHFDIRMCLRQHVALYEDVVNESC